MKHLIFSVVAALVFGAAYASAASDAFRVTPYVQHPATDAMSVMWLTATNGNATIEWWPEGRIAEKQSAAVTPREAEELDYFGYSHPKQYLPALVPWQYRHRITGLAADTRYVYAVTLEDGASYTNAFRTVPSAFRSVRFIAYSDSETQPSSSDEKVVWEDYAVDHDTNPNGCSRRYFIDQTTGYATNLATMVSRQPDFFVVAGDLAEKGSDQTHWDEFWRHNAGALNDPAGSTPIVAAPGNHEYHGYYSADDYGERGMRKYLSYFEYEPNGAAVDDDQQERFHRMDFGPVALIFIDPNNGPDYYSDMTSDTSPNKELYTPNYRDTNQCLHRDRCRAPDFNEGSVQYQWLEHQLADAQTNKLFTFLVCHQCPFSCGYHGRLNGDKGLLSSAEYLSGAATRCLTNLVCKYGVDGWICGHDEIYEHSQVSGTEQCVDGTDAPVTVNVYDIGIGGDGLRGCRRTTDPNPLEVFRAHVDSPEAYDDDGILLDGGKHYGHLEVNVQTNEQGLWTATLTPVYVFVSTNASGVASFERRVYADEIVVTNTVYLNDVPLPGGQTFVWTGLGAKNAKGECLFTNAANWKVQNSDGDWFVPPRAPGMVWDCRQNAQSFTNAWTTYDAYAADEVVFSEGTGADQAIDLSGHVCVSNVTFTGATPVYTFKNYPLAIGCVGTFEIKPDTANLPVLEAGLGAGTGVDKTHTSTVHIINDKAGSFLEMPTFGRPSTRYYINDTHYGYCHFEGAGGFRFGVLSTQTVVNNYYSPASPSAYQVVHRYIYWKQAGKVTFYKKDTSNIWSWIDGLYFDGASATNEVELCEGAKLYVSGGGGRIRCYQNTVFTGPGTLYYPGDMTKLWYWKTASAILAKAGKTAIFRCRLGIYENGSEYLKTMRFIERWEGEDMSGTVDLTEVIANDPVDGVFVHFPVTIVVSGIDGDSSVVSNAFGATATLALTGESTLAYAGPGETTTRLIALTNTAKNAEVGLYDASWPEATLTTTLSQRGTGKWIVSRVENHSVGTQTANLILDNDTAVDAELSAVVGNNLPGTYRTNITKTGAGKWILSDENTTSGALIIQAGEVEESETGKTGAMTYDLEAGTTLRLTGSGVWRQMNLLTARNGASTVAVGAGSTLRLNQVPVSEDGGSVNFVLGTGASLTVKDDLGLKGSYLPDSVTVNGSRAFVGGDGKVVADGSPIVPTSSIPAKGGVITNGEAIVGIVTEGTTGPITLSETATEINMLVQKTETDATVEIAEGETLALKTVIFEQGSGDLTIGGAGSFATVEDVQFTVNNRAGSALTVTAPLSLPSGATVSQIGTGSLALPSDGTWTADFFLASGSLSLGDLDFTSPSETETFTYAAAGETAATLTAKEGSTVHVGGETAADARLALAVPAGEMTVTGADIETASITVGGTGDAKLVVRDNARIYFPEKSGVFQIGPTSGTDSSGLAEMVIEDATVGAVINPGLSDCDFKRFVDRTDRAVVVGGAKGDGLLRIREDAILSNRVALGAANRRAACYMSGGTLVSLGGDCNYGGDRYTHFAYGSGNQSYFEQTGGAFHNCESLQVCVSGGNTTWTMTGGTFWMGLHPLSSKGSGTSYLTFQPSSGEAAVYVGGNAYWDGCYSYLMNDQGTGRSTVTVDGEATMRFMSTMRFADNRLRQMDHPHVYNVNGNGQMHFWSVCFNSGIFSDQYDWAKKWQCGPGVDEKGNRTAAPAYLNVNGGTVVQYAGGSREFIAYATKFGYDYPVFNRVTVYEKGATFQFTNGWMNIHGVVTNATGKGVWAIPLDAALAGSIVPPSVVIEGDGVAATAVALFDSQTQTTTNILVTSHGCDYTHAQAKLYYGSTLAKTIDCELKDNATGTLTFRGTSGQGNLSVYGRFCAPEIVFEVPDNIHVYTNDAISPRTDVVIKSGTLGFAGTTCTWANTPASFRSDTGIGALRADHPAGGYTSQGFPIQGSTGLSWNWQTNYVVGCTTIDCATLVTNRMNGIVPTIADRHTYGLQFKDTATIAFTNLGSLEDDAHDYVIMRWAPTGYGVTTDFFGMPKLATELPTGWFVKKRAIDGGAEIRLVHRKGLALLVK